jgi:CheY-like chemotaxis protein
METELTSLQSGYADSIRLCADQLLSVINDLLDYTKLDAGKMSMKVVPLNPTDSIREVVRALSFQNNGKGLQTIEEIEIDPYMHVMGDPIRLHQILLNILGNSYKFTTKGTVTVKAVGAEEDSEFITITITVADTGIGIPPEMQSKLFQPFTQVDNASSRTFQGTGLGLSICKAIVETLMGGHIWLESNLGQGTTVGFTIRFRKATKQDVTNAISPASPATSPTPARTVQPVTTPEITTPEALSVESTAVNSTPQKATSLAATSPRKDTPHYLDISLVPSNEIRVCIAEDNLINQKIAVSYIQRLGYDCEAFLNGRMAIDGLEKAIIEKRPFHVVLMDVQMPVLDGYDATREIRRHRDPLIREILIIAMTASAIQGDREKCLEAGMNDYLAKPVR